MTTAYQGRMTAGAARSDQEDDKSSVWSEDHWGNPDRWNGIDRIGNSRYNYMMVAYELGNLGGTLGSRGELGYIRRCHFSKQQPAWTSLSTLEAIVSCTLEYIGV